jgi:hypothetical protein
MTFGNFGAASGAQPASPNVTGVQPFAPGAVGQPPGQAGATLPPCYNTQFESLLAAVSRGEVSLNQYVAAGNQFGGVGNANGNPTLMQAFSQGGQMNGTNGLNGNGAGGGTVNSSYASANTVGGTFGPSQQTQTVNAKVPLGDPGYASSPLAAPAQYGGN